jgi:hypothetical protein
MRQSCNIQTFLPQLFRSGIFARDSMDGEFAKAAFCGTYQ